MTGMKVFGKTFQMLTGDCNRPQDNKTWRVVVVVIVIVLHLILIQVHSHFVMSVLSWRFEI